MIQLNGLFCISVKATLVMVAPRFPNEDSSGLNRNTSMSLRRQVLLMNTCRRSWKSSGWEVSRDALFRFFDGEGSLPLRRKAYILQILLRDFLRRTDFFDSAVFEHDGGVTQAVYRAGIMADEQNRIFSWNWRKKRIHFCVKKASPTDSASSTIKISASTWATTAKARRTAMPLE